MFLKPSVAEMDRLAYDGLLPEPPKTIRASLNENGQALQHDPSFVPGLGMQPERESHQNAYFKSKISHPCTGTRMLPPSKPRLSPVILGHPRMIPSFDQVYRDYSPSLHQCGF